MQKVDIGSYIDWLETIENYCMEITETMDGDANVLLWMHNECDTIINSDCNGAANILRKYAVKSNQNIQMDKLTRGRMDRPIRIRCK